MESLKDVFEILDSANPVSGRSRIQRGLFALLLSLSLPWLAAADDPKLMGQDLKTVIKAFPSLNILYSEKLIQEGMVVRNEPQAREPEAILREVLAPFGLTLEAGPGRSLIVVRADLPAPTSTESTPELPSSSVSETIEVSSRYSLLGEGETLRPGLSREEIFRVPHFGDDLFRAVRLLPGVSGNEISARLQVRGSSSAEVQVLLDGNELHDPFHVQDFQGVFSILDPEVIDSVDLLPGTFSAEYGRRSAAVLKMTSHRPRTNITSLGLSFSNAWIGSSGSFAEERGRWVTSLRRGYLDIILELTEGGDDTNPSPQYWDLFGKIEFDWTPTQSVTLDVLVSDDRIHFDEVDRRESLDANTYYGNDYIWASHLGRLGRRGVVQTLAHWVSIRRDRRFEFIEALDNFSIDDQRDSTLSGLKQDWSFSLDRHLLKAGFDFRRIDSDFDYRNDLSYDQPLRDPRFLPGASQVSFRGALKTDTMGFYVSDAVSRGPWTAEVGFRWDRADHQDAELSPRFNLALNLDERGLIRLGWGQFQQFQLPFEVAVEFGESDLQQSSEVEQWSLGYEKRWSKGILRAELFRRDQRQPGPRYESAFDPFTAFPETDMDRLALYPERHRAEGVETFLGVQFTERWRSWLTYTWSSVEDLVDGVWIPSASDQPHALSLSTSWILGEKWSLTGVWIYHTGWPTTSISATAELNDQGRPVVHYQLGDLYGERLANYHRMDLRASYSRKKARGRWTFFVDVQNLYNHVNSRGLEPQDPDFRLNVDGTLSVDLSREEWLGVIPSFGLRWEF